jgi:hypothetical protein
LIFAWKGGAFFQHSLALLVQKIFFIVLSPGQTRLAAFLSREPSGPCLQRIPFYANFRSELSWKSFSSPHGFDHTPMEGFYKMV